MNKDIFASYQFWDKILETRIVHASIRDSFSEREFYSPAKRYEIITTNGVQLTIVSLKRKSVAIYDPETLKNIVNSIDCIHRKRGGAFLQIEPEKDAESINEWIQSALKTRFDGVQLNLCGKYLNTCFMNILQSDNDKAENLFFEKINMALNNLQPISRADETNMPFQ
jgi:hypothetical protein